MKGISRRFPGVLALDAVDLNLRSGEIHCLVGENGAGKSTLMHILAGALQPDAGEMRLEGRVVRFFSPADATTGGIGIVYQDSRLVPELTIEENLTLGQEPVLQGTCFINRRKRRLMARQALDGIDHGLDPRTVVSVLNLADRTLVEMARAISRSQKVLILDEPTAALSRLDADRVMKVIRRLRDSGIAIVYISHRLDEVMAVADRITVLCDGRSMGEYKASELSRKDVVRLMVGRDLGETPSSFVHEVGAVCLEMRQVCTAKLRKVTLDLHYGELVGIAGLVDSGLYSVTRALFGAERVQSGSLAMDGAAFFPNHPKQAIHAGMAFLPEDRNTQGLFSLRSIKENTSIAALASLTRHGWIHSREEKSRVLAILDEMNLSRREIDEAVSVLSGGNRQKVVLGRWLLSGARIFLFNEPTAGIDIGSKQDIHQLMKSLARKGKAILCASSDLGELMDLCDRIFVMNQGRLIGEVEPKQATQEDVMHFMTMEVPADD